MDEGFVKELLRDLRIAFINAGMYHRDHPLVKKSIDNLAETLGNVFSQHSRIEMGITPETIVIAGEEFSGDRLYEETAHYFHLRKVKNVTFRQGLMKEELKSFIGELSASPRSLEETQRVKEIISRKQFPHILIAELDYSPLLGVRSGSQSVPNVWDVLLDKVPSLDGTNEERINQFLNKFTHVMDSIDFSQLESDSETFFNLKQIISQVKERCPDKAPQFGHRILKVILSKQQQIQDEKTLQSIRSLLQDLDQNQTLDVLWNEVFGNKNFNPVIFSVFDRLIERDQKSQYMDLWHDRIENAADMTVDPQLRDKVKNMLVLEETDSYMPPMYRKTLSLLSSRIGGDLRIMLNKNAVSRNYLFALLNLFWWEAHEPALNELADELFKALETLPAFQQMGFFKQVYQVVSDRLARIKDPQVKDNLAEKERELLVMVEKLILKGDFEIKQGDFDYFFSVSRQSQLDVQMYFERIFSESKSCTYILDLFLKFFPQMTDTLIDRLKEETSNIGLLEEVIEALGRTSQRQSYWLLKKIFLFVNPLLKIEVLKAMQGSSFVEEAFIFEHLSQDNVFLKKELLPILKTKSDEVQKQGVHILLSVFNLFGVNNRRLRENIRLLAEAKISCAAGELAGLSRWSFIWGGPSVRKEVDRALNILRVTQ